jgi:hypothetical protein
MPAFMADLEVVFDFCRQVAGEAEDIEEGEVGKIFAVLGVHGFVAADHADAGGGVAHFDVLI